MTNSASSEATLVPGRGSALTLFTFWKTQETTLRLYLINLHEMTLKPEKLHCDQHMISAMSNSHKSTHGPSLILKCRIKSILSLINQIRQLPVFSLYTADIRLYFTILDKIQKLTHGLLNTLV